MSNSNFPSNNSIKDNIRSSNATTPKLLKQIRPLFPEKKPNNFSLHFKNIEDQSNKCLTSASKKFLLGLDEVKLSPIKLNSSKKDYSFARENPNINLNLETNSNNISLFNFEKSLFSRAPQKTIHTFSRNLMDPFVNCDQVKDKSKNYDYINNSYKDKTSNFYNDFRGHNSSSDQFFINRQPLSKGSKNYTFFSNEPNIKKENSNFIFQNYDSDPPNTNRNGSLFFDSPFRGGNETRESATFMIPRKKENINEKNNYKLKNLFDFEENSPYELNLENSLGNEDFARNGERGI